MNDTKIKTINQKCKMRDQDGYRIQLCEKCVHIGSSMVCKCTRSLCISDQFESCNCECAPQCKKCYQYICDICDHTCSKPTDTSTVGGMIKYLQTFDFTMKTSSLTLNTSADGMIEYLRNLNPASNSPHITIYPK